MSVEFDVCGCKLDADGWDEVLAAWEATQEGELFREPVFQEGTAFLLGKGGIRGAALSLDGDVVHLRLNALSSRADWRRAFQVVRRALEKGGGNLVREDGQSFAAAQLTDAQADEQATTDFCATLGMMRASFQQGSAALPLDAFSLVLQPGELPGSCTPAEMPAIEARLAAQVARYAEAFPAATFVLKGGLKLTTWARIATLVGPADLVSIEGLEEPVPLEELKKVLGPRAEDAGEGVTFLPELTDSAEDQALLGTLRGVSTSLEAYARARGIELPSDAGELDDEDGLDEEDLGGDMPAIYAELAQAIGRVVQAAMTGQDPRAVRRALIKDGASEQSADLALHVVARILGELMGDGSGQPAQRTPEELVQALVADGLPPGVAAVAVGAMADALGGEGGDEPPPPPPKKSGLILPPGY